MEWFENDNFWYDLVPYIFNPTVIANAHSEVEAMIQLSGVSGGSVLDLCCGVGRHTLAFAARGFQATGVDLNRLLLDEASKAAAAQSLPAEWIGADMRRFNRTSAFNLCINMYNSFGYFVSSDDDRQVLANVHSSLTENGVFILDTPGKEVIAAQASYARVDHTDQGLLYRDLFVDAGWDSLTERWLHWSKFGRKQYVLRHSIYSGREITDLLHCVGFTHISLYGDFDGRPYDRHACRLLAFARR